MTLGAEVRAVADAHNWSFEKAWNFLQCTQPALFLGSKGSFEKQEGKDPQHTVVEIAPKVAAGAEKVMLVQAIECDMATKLELNME